MSPSFLLFVAALAGGALNAVAGGGSFIALPALLWAGVPPVAANATTTFALWPGSMASAWAYRREVRRTAPRTLALLGAISVLGGLAGGLLLMRTSDAAFLRLLPWLMLVAAVSFTAGGRLAASLRRHERQGELLAFSPLAAILQLAIAAYGGYFGGGIGIMMLAMMSVAGMTHIHEMNGLKSLLAVAINGVALAEFVAHGAIVWAPGLVMVAGGMLGGYAGAAVARRIPGAYVRAFVIAIAWTMTLYFFVA